MKLEGSLDTFPLRELLDMISYSSVTGVLHIYGPGTIGNLYFREGRLYHAEHGPTDGVEALAELIDFQQATFSFVSDIDAAQESLRGNTATYLTAAEQTAARWRKLRPYVPNPDVIPRLIGPRETSMRRAGRAHAPVITAIDGQASVRRIAATLGWTLIDLAETLAELALDGLVDLRVAHPNLADSHHQQSERGGFFDRLRSLSPAAHTDDHLQDQAERTPAEELTLRLLRGSG